jgi:hypothetical protein
MQHKVSATTPQRSLTGDEASRATGRLPWANYREGMFLFAAFLGGPMRDGRMGESHEVVFVVATDLKDAKAKAKAKWHGTGRGHIDALQQIEMVDGFEVSLVAGGEGDRIPLDSYN